MTLKIGQYSLGGLVMGRGTPYKIESVDIGNYDINVQDYQPMSSNETYFGQDTFKPASMQLTINILKNRLLENVAALVNYDGDLTFDDDPGLTELQRVWRQEDIMSQWGFMAPFYFCGTDGITKAFWGRPGKFSYKNPKQIRSEYHVCQAEWRRADTYAHSEAEYFVDIFPGSPQTITLTKPTAPSWPRFLITGPANHPIINFGSRQLELDYNVTSGMVAEICTYPWQRRVINDSGLSLAAYLIADEPYLDKIRWNDHESKTISFAATGTSGSTKLRLLWHDAYQVME